jgi:2-keto-3-deoxy-L-rhamnonate aldolase RhmA
VPANDETWIKKCLDIGASGIIVPQIMTFEDAAYAVRCCKYPPQGTRSIGISRAQGYGAEFQDYVASANNDIAVILQIENRSAVDHIEEICNLPGIDALFVGPYDLSAGMGKTGLTTDPEVQNAISQVKHCADRAGIPLGIFGVSEEALKPYIENGYSLIAAGIDTMIFGEAAGRLAHFLKE